MLGQDHVQREQVEGLHKLFRVGLIHDWSIAIDGGAHIGTWSVVMAGRFKRVIAFEPTPETFEMLAKNMEHFSNVECRNEALMDREGLINMEMPEHNAKHQRAYAKKINDGLESRYAQWNDKGEVVAVTIDGLGLPSCGLIKLDLEGAEYLALQGARKTIARFKPVVAVEIKRHAKRYGIKRAAVDIMLKGMDYRIEFRRRYDVFYIPH